MSDSEATNVRLWRGDEEIYPSSPEVWGDFVRAFSSARTAEEVEAFRAGLEQMVDSLIGAFSGVAMTAAQVAARFSFALDAIDKEATSYFRYKRIQRRIVERGPRRRKHDGRWAKLRRR